MGVLDSTHTFTIKVGGTDVTGYLVHDTFVARNALGQEIDTCDFVLEDKDGGLGNLGIGEWDEVVVTDESSNKVFAGFVTRIREEVSPAPTRKRMKLSCQDYTVLLKKVVVSKAYHDQTDEAIIDDLFATYLSEFTTNNVNASSGTHSFAFDNITLWEAMRQISERTGYEWYVDYDKNLHYFRKGQYVAAPFDLADATSADFSTSFPWQKGSLSLEWDGEEVVNRVTVHGGIGESAVTTETFSGDGSTVEFYLSNRPIRSIVDITVNGVKQTWATDFVTTTFSSVDVLVNYHRGRIRWDASRPPAAGTNNIVVRYTYDQPVQVTRDDAASQTKYGRVFEQVVVRRDISTVEEARALADQILEEKAFKRRVGRVTVERYGLRAGQVIAITCSALGLSKTRGYGTGGYGQKGYGGDFFLINSVTTRYSRRGVEHTVSFADYRPDLGKLVRDIVEGRATTGGLPASAGGGAAGGGLSSGILGIPASAGLQLTREADVFYGGRFEALDKPGVFSWSAYGDVTGVVLGLDETGPAPQGKLLGLNAGSLQAYFDSDGKMKCAGGNIILDSSGITASGSSALVKAGSGEDVVVLDGADTTYRIYAGSSTPSSAPFRVDKDGNLTATSVNVVGTVDVSSSGVIKSGAAGYDSGVGWWLEYNAGTPRFFVGDSAGNKLLWDGTTLTLAGDGSGITNLDGANVQAGTITADKLSVAQLSAIAADMGLLTAGEIRIGSGTPGTDFTGLRLYKSGNTYRLEGQNAGTLEAYFDSDGKLYCAGGDIRLDSDGIIMGISAPEAEAFAHFATSGEKYMFLEAYSGSSTNTCDIKIRKSASATIGTKSSTANGEYLGTVRFGGVNLSGGFSDNGLIIGVQEGAPGTNRVPVAIEVWTGTASSAKTPRVRFHAAGGQTWYFATQDLKFVDAGSVGATEQAWIEVTVGGTTGYVRVYASK